MHPRNSCRLRSWKLILTKSGYWKSGAKKVIPNGVSFLHFFPSLFPIPLFYFYFVFFLTFLLYHLFTNPLVPHVWGMAFNFRNSSQIPMYSFEKNGRPQSLASLDVYNYENSSHLHLDDDIFQYEKSDQEKALVRRIDLLILPLICMVDFLQVLTDWTGCAEFTILNLTNAFASSFSTSQPSIMRQPLTLKRTLDWWEANIVWLDPSFMRATLSSRSPTTTYSNGCLWPSTSGPLSFYGAGCWLPWLLARTLVRWWRCDSC